MQASLTPLPVELEPELRGPALSPGVDKRPLFKEHWGKTSRPCQSWTNSPLTPWASLLEKFKEGKGDKRNAGRSVTLHIHCTCAGYATHHLAILRLSQSNILHCGYKVMVLCLLAFFIKICLRWNQLQHNKDVDILKWFASGCVARSAHFLLMSCTYCFTCSWNFGSMLFPTFFGCNCEIVSHVLVLILVPN